MIGVSIEEAIEKLFALPCALPAETLPLGQSQGRALSEDITAAVDVPPFDRSPYDGYAFRGADTSGASQENPAVLKILEEVPAGKAPTKAVVPGTAVKILTGAPIPEGADAVVKYETTAFTEDTVSIFRPVRPNTDIVPAGEDVKKGEVLARKGTVMDPALAGVLAGQGLDRVRVISRPKAAVMSTGSELLEAGQPPEPGKIYNSNTVLISAWLEKLGLEAMPEPSVSDDPEAIAERIKDALARCDLAVTTGGASVGDYDFAARAAELMGAEVLFKKIDMKPGGSVTAAQKDGKLILCLSGNPGAALTTLLRVAAPYLRKLAGQAGFAPEAIELPLKEDYKKASPRRRIVRGRLELEKGRAWFVPQDKQGNGVASSFLGCDLLGEIPAGSPPLKAGEMILAYPV